MVLVSHVALQVAGKMALVLDLPLKEKDRLEQSRFNEFVFVKYNIQSELRQKCEENKNTMVLSVSWI